MRFRARGRHKPGVMNRLETRYAAIIEGRRMAGGIVWWAFESIKFKLADKTFYTPDFLVMLPDCTLEVHEVKGFWEDDARVKIKVAAAKFPIAFKGISFDRIKGWVEEEF